MTRHYKTSGYRCATYDVILRVATHSYVKSLRKMGIAESTAELIPGGFYTEGTGY